MSVSPRVRGMIKGSASVYELKGAVVKGILALKESEPEHFKEAANSPLEISDIAIAVKAADRVREVYKYDDHIQHVIETEFKASISSADLTIVGKDKVIKLPLSFSTVHYEPSVRNYPVDKKSC